MERIPVKIISVIISKKRSNQLVKIDMRGKKDLVIKLGVVHWNALLSANACENACKNALRHLLEWTSSSSMVRLTFGSDVTFRRGDQSAGDS